MSASETVMPTVVRATRVLTVIVPMILALTLALVRSAQTPLWRDEFATAMFASLSPAELLAATSHVDAVLAPYYLLIHFLSPLTGLGTGMRVVSIVSFALTAGVVSIVALRWWGSMAALVAGIAIAVNTDVLFAAVNSRPYAPSLLLLAGAVLAMDSALSTGRRWQWWCYAVAAAGVVALHLFAVLPVALTYLLLWHRSRTTVTRWALASVPAVATAAALLIVGMAHRGQLVWLPKPDIRDAVQSVARLAGVSLEVAVVFDAITLLALLGAATLSILGSIHRRGDTSLSPVISRSFAFALMIVPPVVLFVASWAITPVFSAKYFIWSSIGAALVLGGATALAVRPRNAAGVLAVILSGALLVTSAVSTGIRMSHIPVPADNFPAVVEVLESSGAVGDTVVIAQPYAFGGVAYGFAVSARDDGHAAEVADHAIAGTHPVLDVREITNLDNLRTVPTDPTGAGARTWVMTIFPLTDEQLATVDRPLRDCLSKMDFESPIEQFGALRVFDLRCE